MDRKLNLTCPIPVDRYPTVTLAHGGGGRMTSKLIREMFFSAFDNSILSEEHDAAVVSLTGSKIAITTDSYVVSPLFFPGGDIGKIAIHGTVNDLAMSGARPRYLSVAFILEEGLSMETLWNIVLSMKEASLESDVEIIAGDTKVVDRGKCDGLFLNVTGVGVVEHDLSILPRSVLPGDVLLLSGDIGRHGIAILSAREGLDMGSAIETDSAPLWNVVNEMIVAGINIHCLRDLTRGGMASALVEIAETIDLNIHIREDDISIHEKVKGVCEILGFDPLSVANEGRFVAIVDEKDWSRALEIMKTYNSSATRVGVVGLEPPGVVTMETVLGTSRVVDMMSGEQLPRIC